MRRILTIVIVSSLSVLCFAVLAALVRMKHSEQGGVPVPEGNTSVPAPKIHEENPYYLRADKRLQVSLNVQSKQPKLSQILAQLGEATGLDIAVDGNLQGHDPDYGYIQPSKQGYYAWQIMEMVARKDLQYGCWEKTDRGYRLAGISVVPAKSPMRTRPDRNKNASSRHRRMAFTGISLLVLVAIMAILRKRNASSPS